MQAPVGHDPQFPTRPLVVGMDHDFVATQRGYQRDLFTLYDVNKYGRYSYDTITPAPTRYYNILINNPPNNKNCFRTVMSSFSNHTAYIIDGNVIRAKHPPSERTYIRGMQVMSSHAEIEALRVGGMTGNFGYIPRYIKPTRGYQKVPRDFMDNYTDRKTKKYVMMVVRACWNDDNDSYTLRMSKPCLHCAYAIASAGIRTIIYSTDDGTLVKSNIYEDKFKISSGMLHLSRMG